MTHGNNIGIPEYPAQSHLHLNWIYSFIITNIIKFWSKLSNKTRLYLRHHEFRNRGIIWQFLDHRNIDIILNSIFRCRKILHKVISNFSTKSVSSTWNRMFCKHTRSYTNKTPLNYSAPVASQFTKKIFKHSHPPSLLYQLAWCHWKTLQFKD